MPALLSGPHPGHPGSRLGLPADPGDLHVILAAFQAVRKMGSAAVPGLKAGLRDESRSARRFAILGLELLEIQEVSELKMVAPEVLAALNDRDPLVRRSALSLATSEMLALESRGLVPALVQFVKDGDRDARYAAARALCELGERAPSARRALRALLRDPNAAVRRAVHAPVRDTLEEED
jgi:HEAT repeat protein